MMFALTVLRILLTLSFLLVLCSGQKSFLKGLLIGSILGHKKGSMLQEGKGESKDIHHYEKEYYPSHSEKEYVPVPVHEEPKYFPVYIVKECPKKSYSEGVLHHHDHHHNYDYASNKLSDFGSGYGGYSGEEYGYASASKNSGTLPYGYSEDKYKPMNQQTVPIEPNLTTGYSSKEQDLEADNTVGIVLSVHKDFAEKY